MPISLCLSKLSYIGFQSEKPNLRTNYTLIISFSPLFLLILFFFLIKRLIQKRLSRRNYIVNALMDCFRWFRFVKEWYNQNNLLVAQIKMQFASLKLITDQFETDYQIGYKRSRESVHLIESVFCSQVKDLVKCQSLRSGDQSYHIQYYYLTRFFMC